MDFLVPALPQSVETQLIGMAFTQPKAIVAAMMSAGYAAIARVAEGATWEREPEILIDPELCSHADRMALIWKRAAENLQGAAVVAMPPRPRNPAGLDKRIPYPSRSRPPL